MVSTILQSVPPTVHTSLLARHLGSEEAADAWRRGRDLRERTALRAAVARDMRGREPTGIPAVERELRLVRELLQQQTATARRVAADEVERRLAEELPEAVAYLTHPRMEVQRNGKT